jgi:hypothetical protein
MKTYTEPLPPCVHKWVPDQDPERGAGYYRCSCGAVGHRHYYGPKAGHIVAVAQKWVKEYELERSEAAYWDSLSDRTKKHREALAAEESD